MPKVRIKFAKIGAASFLSHLDVMRTFSRAFNRAGITLRHTEGFNPHPYLSIAHPLPVGFTSDSEILDCETTQDFTEDFKERLNKALPTGLEILEAYIPETTVKDIAFAEYIMTYSYYGSMPENAAESLNELFKQKEIMIQKRSKKGMTTINLTERFESVTFTKISDSKIQADLLLKIKEAPLNPRYFLDAINQPELKPDFSHYHRIHYLNQDLTLFV